MTLALAIVACDTPTSAVNRPVESGSASFDKSIPVQSDLGTEIRSLVTTDFPRGDATAILAQWDIVLRSLAKNPRTTLKGKTVPGSGGRAELVRAISYIQLRASTATPPAGETRDHFIARLVLDMSLYVYGGASTPVPSMTPTSDVAFDVVLPTNADTVVTTAKQAAVIFPTGAVSEPTVVVITPDTAYYPANCSGPLVTHLCQYPRFYRFNVFPDVKLNTAAKVQVCHVDAGTTRLPLADHDRFRVAHDRPLDPADYSAGSTIVDSVEVLALAPMNVTTCTANGGTTYTAALAPDASPLRRFAAAGTRMLHRMASGMGALLSPREALAIDVGGGGFTESFSTYGVVDPASKPDLAQTPSGSGRFAPAIPATPVGSTVSVPAWTITNLGSGTSSGFVSRVVIATDSALTSEVSAIPVGGGASLVPGATYSYPALSVTLPATPGTYYLGTRVIPAGADSTASDDRVSVLVTVTSAAPPPPPVNQYSLASQATYSTGTSGGGGGSPYTISCPAGSVATGLTGQTGSYYGWASVFNAGLQCAPLLADGSLGTPVTTAQAGQYQSGTPFAGTCGGGGLLVGGSGHTTGGSPMVADLGGSCASLASVMAHGLPTSAIGPWTGSGVNYQVPFTLNCNPGDVVTGLQGRSGDILDVIGFQCTPVISPNGP